MKDIDKFWKYVDKTNSCWIWTRSLNHYGYGQFSIGADNVHLAHRWIYQQINNKTLPRHIKVCHSCDTPACVRPDHLFEGTHKDNMNDRDSKGRQSHNRKNNAKLTESDIRIIRSDKRPRKVLADHYGVDVATISRIRLKHNWWWVK
jgi:hypothetical protein